MPHLPDLTCSGSAVVRPGDSLVIAFSPVVDLDEVQRVCDGLSDALPGVKIVVVDQVTSMVVYRATEGEVTTCPASPQSPS